MSNHSWASAWVEKSLQFLVLPGSGGISVPAVVEVVSGTLVTGGGGEGPGGGQPRFSNLSGRRRHPTDHLPEKVVGGQQAHRGGPAALAGVGGAQSVEHLGGGVRDDAHR